MNNIKKFGAVCGEFQDVADFITIYIAEAHPFDSGDLADEYKHKYNTHIQMEDRIKVRNLFFSLLSASQILIHIRSQPWPKPMICK